MPWESLTLTLKKFAPGLIRFRLTPEPHFGGLLGRQQNPTATH